MFPYGNGEQFLETEIRYLAAYFKQVILVPFRITGQARPLPSGTIVRLDFAHQRPESWQRYLNTTQTALLSTLFYRELLARPQTLYQPSALKRLLVYTANLVARYQWLETFIQTIRPESTIFYSYWLLPYVLGLAQLKSRHPDLKVISRAHGSDLYEYVFRPAYQPFWEMAVQKVDALFPISENGKAYILQKYPAAEPRCEVSRLGVPHPGFQNTPSSDGIFRIVSCSSMVPIKCLDRIIDGLAAFSHRHPQQLIEWHHLGDGPLRDSLDKYAKAQLPANVRYQFYGRLSNQQVFDFYQEQSLDVFINTSSSEGIPVSVMEAQSCGIPAIAPAVGGIPEIVETENGILLNRNPTATDIALALETMRHQPTTHQKRNASYETWNTRFNADRNYPAFILRVMERLN